MLKRRPLNLKLIAAAIFAVPILWYGFVWWQTQRLRSALESGDVPGAVQAIRLGALPDGSYDIQRENTIHELYTGQTCLIRAIALGSPRAEPIVREMLRHGADPSRACDWTTDGSNGWDAAIAEKNASLIRLMLAEGAKPTDRDLEYSVGSGTVEIFQLLWNRLENRSVRSEPGLLHSAAFSGNLDIMVYLLDQGIPIDAPTEGERETALMSAIRGNGAAVVPYLLQRGADVHRRNVYDMTVMDYAVENRSRSLEALEQAKEMRITDPQARPDDSEVRRMREWVREKEATIRLLRAHGAHATGHSRG